MKVAMSSGAGTLDMRFELAPEEPRTTRPTTMGHRASRVVLPDGWTPDDAHPDLIALAILLMCEPFTNRTVQLPFPVSQHFADACTKAFAAEVTPVSSGLAPRQPPGNGVPALAFSGGVDSVAALTVLPPETEVVFLDRISPDGFDGRSLYRPAAAYHTIATIEREHGRRVTKVGSDLEFLRSPVGFPLDVTNAVPAILLADRLGLDAVGWGSVLEGGYRIGKSSFTEYPTRRDWRRTRLGFEAVGLPYLQGTVGVSEVGTSIVESRSPYAGLAQSCIRGNPGQPCMRCRKCFRKALLGRVLQGEPIADDLVDHLLTSPEVRTFVTGMPIHYEDVMAYVMTRYRGEHPVMRLLQERVTYEDDPLDWLERYYRPSLDLLPDKYAPVVRERLDSYLSPMSAADEARLRAWDPEPVVNDPRRQEVHRRLVAVIEADHTPKPGTPPASPPRDRPTPARTPSTQPSPAGSPWRRPTWRALRDPRSWRRGLRRRRAAAAAALRTSVWAAARRSRGRRSS